MDELSIQEAVNTLAERLRKVPKPYAGAQFRFAFMRGPQTPFLTGSVAFCPEPVVSRPTADYGRLVFVEHWCREQGEALKLLSTVLSGQAEFGGFKVDSVFSHSYFSHQPLYFFGRGLRSGWELMSRSTSRQMGEQLSQGSVFGFGLRPYLGPNHAIGDWVFDMHHENTSNNVPDLDALKNLSARHPRTIRERAVGSRKVEDSARS